MGNRCARAAGAKLHHAFERHVRQATLEGAGETGPVGVVADPLAVFQQYRVDGAQGARVIRQFVEQRNDLLLARIRDVQTVEAHPFRCDQKVRQR